MSGPILLILRFLLAALLYAFVGWALYALWRDLQQQAELLAARQAPPLSLALEAETLPAGAAALPQRSFAQTEIVLGRGAACDLSLDDKTVSARHARCTYHHGQWWLEDLGSTNGTFLNNELVETAVVITSGVEVRVGSVVVKVEIGA
jgi:pSer/pThr/pTyr-binding forkhead associated (FHA) protein